MNNKTSCLHSSWEGGGRDKIFLKVKYTVCQIAINAIEKSTESGKSARGGAAILNKMVRESVTE